MRFSREATKILTALELGLIKSNANFWSSFAYKNDLDRLAEETPGFSDMFDRLETDLAAIDDQEGIICAYDPHFPVINKNVKNKSEKPFLLFYKGDPDLLTDLNDNVAVIGLTDPDDDIKQREREMVKRLMAAGMTIVSGLALGCDTIAHQTALDCGGKTLAILPSPINNIFPAENRRLAESIVEKGGLLVSEYYKEPVSRYEAINRFVERDRLQAMFSKAVILTASYRKNEGDSGSRHAMESARKYGIARYVMYNEKIDRDNKRFGLNRDLVEGLDLEPAQILTQSSIDEIKSLVNTDLDASDMVNRNIEKQLSLL